MTIRVRIPGDAIERVRFSLSPFMEALWSLHVLHNPTRHVINQNWVRTMRKRNVHLTRELREFGFAYRGSPTSCGVPLPNVERGSFADEVARFRRATPAQAARFFTRSFYEGREEISATEDVPSPVAERLLAHARAIHASVEWAQHALRSPQQSLTAFADLMERYWYSGFDELWQGRVLRLEGEVGKARDRIATRGLPDFLRTLPRDVRLDPDGQGFTVDRPHDHELTIGEANRLVLTPSVYVLPHVHVSCDRPGVVAIAYPSTHEVQLATPLPPPEPLLAALDALADDTRLRILRHLREVPRTTQVLAQLVQVAPPTVSSHLRRLEAAGLVTSERDGHYVLYQLTLDVTRIMGQLRDYLDDRLDPL
jgi:DNA-binding transcriptional ArsR family regulator